jgi:hypothetical protein
MAPVLKCSPTGAPRQGGHKLRHQIQENRVPARKLARNVHSVIPQFVKREE